MWREYMTSSCLHTVLNTHCPEHSALYHPVLQLPVTVQLSKVQVSAKPIQMLKCSTVISWLPHITDRADRHSSTIPTCIRPSGVLACTPCSQKCAAGPATNNTVGQYRKSQVQYSTSMLMGDFGIPETAFLSAPFQVWKYIACTQLHPYSLAAAVESEALKRQVDRTSLVPPTRLQHR